MLLSIVICTRNRAETLRDVALAGLDSQASSEREIIVVDHGSTDNTKAFVMTLQQSRTDLKYVPVAAGATFGDARNAGWKAASGDIIIYLDDDATPLPGWQDEALAQFSQNADLAVLGGPAFEGDSSEIPNDGWIIGCNMAFRASVFRRFSFDPGLSFLGSIYCDEHDLIARIRSSGLTVSYSEAFPVRHYKQSVSNVSIKNFLGYSLNRGYSQCKRDTTFRYFRYLVGGLIKIGLSPSRKTLSELTSDKEWSIEAMERTGVSWLNSFYKLYGIRGIGKWFWTAFIEIPRRATRRRVIELKMLAAESNG
jgi:glycosyltransferase involved in cell wall biosynthesis